MASLRNESKGNKAGGKKNFVATKGGKHGKFRKGGKKGGDNKPHEKKERDPVKRQEQLDKDLESYWVKGGHTEMAAKRLDDDLENYFNKAAEPVAEVTDAVAGDAAKTEEVAKE